MIPEHTSSDRTSYPGDMPTSDLAVTTGRPLKRGEQLLPNGVRLQALVLPKPKGRHWVALLGRKKVGEFKTWQETDYIPPAEEGGPPKYRSHMVRTSWVVSDPDVTDAHADRIFYGKDGWKVAVADLQLAGPEDVTVEPPPDAPVVPADDVTPLNAVDVEPGIDSVPSDWEPHEDYLRFFTSIFAGSASEIEMWPHEDIDPAMAWKHLQAVCGCFGFKHDDKERLWCWLAQHWFSGFRYRAGDTFYEHNPEE